MLRKGLNQIVEALAVVSSGPTLASNRQMTVRLKPRGLARRVPLRRKRNNILEAHHINPGGKTPHPTTLWIYRPPFVGHVTAEISRQSAEQSCTKIGSCKLTVCSFIYSYLIYSPACWKKLQSYTGAAVCKSASKFRSKLKENTLNSRQNRVAQAKATPI